MKRLLSLFTAALMLGSVIGLTTATPVFASSYTTCGSGSNIGFFFFSQKKLDTQVNDYFDGVKANTYVRDLHSCVDMGWGSDGTWILPANITGGGNGDLVQLGYGEDDGDASPHFVWTGTCDHCSGNSATPTWAPSPVVGHNYGWDIEWISGSWYFQITDYTAGTTYHSPFVTATWRSGTVAWWGAEVHNKNSAIGVDYGTPSIKMNYMQYHEQNANLWMYRTGFNGCIPEGGYPSYGHCYSETTRWTNDTIGVYTTTDAH